MLKKYVPFVFSIGLSLGIGGFSALLTKESMDIYSEINQPPLAPPASLFPIAWTVLYILMGISAALVWKTNRHEIDSALIFYGFQLVFNFCWSIIFFNFRAFLLSFLWLLVMLTLIGITSVKFCRILKTAGWLMLPYFLWVCFAGYLNFAIYLLNP